MASIVKFYKYFHCSKKHCVCSSHLWLNEKKKQSTSQNGFGFWIQNNYVHLIITANVRLCTNIKINFRLSNDRWQWTAFRSLAWSVRKFYINSLHLVRILHLQSLSSENDASPIFRKLRRILAMLCWNSFIDVVSDSSALIFWLLVWLPLPLPPPPPLPLPLRLLLLFPSEKCLFKWFVFEMPELPGHGVTAIPLSGVNSQSLQSRDRLATGVRSMRDCPWPSSNVVFCLFDKLFRKNGTELSSLLAASSSSELLLSDRRELEWLDRLPA